MYAVIRTGGKQYRVIEGERLAVERLTPPADDEDLRIPAVLVVDGDRVLASPDQLAGAEVRARVLGESKGPKIRGFTYKPKSNNRRRWGHRQRCTTIEIVSITAGG